MTYSGPYSGRGHYSTPNQAVQRPKAVITVIMVGLRWADPRRETVEPYKTFWFFFSLDVQNHPQDIRVILSEDVLSRRARLGMSFASIERGRHPIFRTSSRRQVFIDIIRNEAEKVASLELCKSSKHECSTKAQLKGYIIFNRGSQIDAFHITLYPRRRYNVITMRRHPLSRKAD